MQIQRLFEITYILLQRKRVTARELADRFEVSTRTIYRDLDTLSMAGIPLYTNKGNNGGIFLLEDYTLSKTLLSDEEQQHMLSALQSYHAAGRDEVSSLLTKLSSQFQKEQVNWIDVDFDDWSGDSRNSTYFRVLKEAILKNKVLSFTYYNSYGNCKNRHVEPLRLLFKGQSWYLIAYCMDAKAQRMFKLNRMENIQLQNEDISHGIDEEALTKSYHCDVKDMVEITAKADRQLAFRIFDEYLPQNYEKQDDGSLLLHIAFPQGKWIYSYLMGFGPGLKVLEPACIRDELLKRYREAIQYYEESV